MRFTGERTAQLGVSGLREGEYTFELEVSDGAEQLAYDEVKVFVTAGKLTPLKS